MTQSTILYSYWRSSCAWRVRIALNLKRIPYEYKAVHLVKREQHHPEFVALNPSAQVPLLVIDGVHLTESIAILEYLEETRPDHPLLPKSPKARAHVRRIVEMINAGIQPKQNLAVLNYVQQITSDDTLKKSWAAHWVSQGLHAVEKLLQSTAATYCVSDHITFADCVLVPQFASAARFDIDVNQFPTIQRIVRSLETNEAFVNAHPSAQPDAP